MPPYRAKLLLFIFSLYIIIFYQLILCLFTVSSRREPSQKKSASGSCSSLIPSERAYVLSLLLAYLPHKRVTVVCSFSFSLLSKANNTGRKMVVTITTIVAASKNPSISITAIIAPAQEPRIVFVYHVSRISIPI